MRGQAGAGDRNPHRFKLWMGSGRPVASDAEKCVNGGQSCPVARAAFSGRASAARSVQWTCPTRHGRLL